MPVDPPVLQRAFVAVVVPETVREALARAVAEAEPSSAVGVRWTPRTQWHLTLRFLGQVIEPSRLADALRHALAAEAPGPVGLGGAGAFPSPGNASVVWVGVHTGADVLTRLAVVAERVAVAHGFAPEPRPFRPHLTFARLRRPAPVHRLLDALGTEAIGPMWTVDRVVLFESDTRPDGARHHAVRTLAVGAA